MHHSPKGYNGGTRMVSLGHLACEFNDRVKAMDISYSGTYKSLTRLTIQGLPKFTVITGPNGSGKSQFLELIQLATQPKKEPHFNISEAYRSDEVLLLTSEWTNLTNAKSVGFQAVQKQHDQFWRLFQQFASNRSKSHLSSIFQDVVSKTGKSVEEVTKDDFTMYFDISAPQAQTQVFNQSIGQAFLDFRIRQLEADSSGQTVAQEPPWNLLRQIIAKAKLPFTFGDPSKTSIRSTYTFQLRHSNFDKDIQFSDLSAGEKVLMSLVFWLFHVQRTKVFPRLLLLDEPDAHLHPEMCKQFIDVVDGVLVKQYDVRVIVATHNPTTVALVDRNSIYEMFPENDRIRKVLSKAEAIERLTAGLLNVSEAKTVVIVEDEDDEKFFQCLFDEAAVDVSEATRGIREGGRLVFVQASRPRHNRSSGDTCGGRSEVEKWVPKLKNAGIDSIVGLVDWDNKDDTSASVYLLSRYSIENFIVDPIVIYSRLAAEDQAPEIEGISKPGKNRAHTVSTWGNTLLQTVADDITGRIWNRLCTDEVKPAESPEKVSITFINGASLRYPRWIVDYRGKDILRAAIDEFGGQYVNREKLNDSFQQLMLIPDELIDLFAAINSRSKLEPRFSSTSDVRNNATVSDR
ncbi:MAG: AAA family ATPase [Planctomycetota bacterium]